MRNYWDDFKSLTYKKWKDKRDVESLGEDNAPSNIGLVAQEVEPIFPSLVTESGEQPNPETGVLEPVFGCTTYKAVKSSIIEGPIMASVVQELQTRVESLEACVITLGG